VGSGKQRAVMVFTCGARPRRGVGGDWGVPAGRAIVIGGSLAGLMAGLLLRRQFAVDIYERADAELAGRGTGIVTHELLGEVLDAAGIAWRQGLGIEVQTRRFF